MRSIRALHVCSVSLLLVASSCANNKSSELEKRSARGAQNAGLLTAKEMERSDQQMISLANRLRQQVTDLNKRPYKPLLWRVEGPGKPSYLLATVHMGISTKQVPAYVWHALDSSQAVVFETNMGMYPMQHFSNKREHSPGAFTKTRLDTQLTPAMWHRLTGHLSPEHVEKMRFASPMHAAMVLAARFPMGEGIDYRLLERTVFSCRVPLGLETAKEQRASFTDYTIDHLRFSLMKPDVDIKYMIETLEAWLSGDRTAMLSIDARYPGPKPRPRFGLHARNRRWLPKIEGYIKHGGAFIAAGTSHWLGDTGLITMLRERGHKIVRVESGEQIAQAPLLTDRKYHCPTGSEVGRSYHEEDAAGQFKPVPHGKPGIPLVMCSNHAGKMDGPSLICHPNGRVRRYSEVVGNKPHRIIIEWRDNGIKAAETRLGGGKRHGVARAWHPNGQLATEVMFQHGKQVGAAKLWDANGKRSHAKSPPVSAPRRPSLRAPDSQ